MDDTSIRTAVAAWLEDAAAAEAAYGHISTWDTSGVTDMEYLFSPCDWDSRCNSAAASFNEDIGAWDTSGVVTMNRMFQSASAFDQDIGGWAIEGVESMPKMFFDATSFDQDLGWCVDDDVEFGGDDEDDDDDDEDEDGDEDEECCVEHSYWADGSLAGTTCPTCCSPFDASTMSSMGNAGCTGYSDAGEVAPPFRDCRQEAIDADAGCGTADWETCAACADYGIPTGMYFSFVGYASCPDWVVDALYDDAEGGGNCESHLDGDDDDDDGDGSLTFQDAFAGTKCASTSCGVVQSSNCGSPAPTPAPTPSQTLVKVASSVTLEGIVADDFNADEGMKTAFAESILASAGGEFDEVIDIEAVGRRRLAAGAGVGVSYTGVARVVGTDDAASVGADLLEQASDALTAALGDGSFLTTLQATDTAFAAVTVDVAATQAAIADAALEVIITTPSPTVSPTPRPTVAPTVAPTTVAQIVTQTVTPTVAPTATRGSDSVGAARRLSGVSAALLVLALAA